MYAHMWYTYITLSQCLFLDSCTLTNVYKEYFTAATVTQKLKAILLQVQIQQAINNMRVVSCQKNSDNQGMYKFS